MTVRLEFLGDDGEWHELEGVTNVQFRPSGPDVTDEEWRRHDALDSLVYMFTAHEDAARPRVIDQDGNPVRTRADRPAWQSPYGPPPRRR